MFFQGVADGVILFLGLAVITIILNVVIRVKWGAYEYATKHVLAYTFLIFPILFIIINKLCNILQLDTAQRSGHLLDVVENIALNVVSNYVILIAFALAFFFERFIKNRYEDGEKLTKDYAALVKLYEKETNWVSAGKTVYPVFSLGEGDVCVYTKEQGLTTEGRVEIDDNKTEYRLPILIETNFSELIKVHDSSVLYNNLNIRVVDMILADDQFKLSTERTYYFYSMVTNRASDYDWGKDGVTVRSLYEPGPLLHTLSDSSLSNHLGFNGFLITKDNYVVFVKRSKNLSIAKRTYGDSINASLKTKYALNEDGEFTAEKLVEAIVHEIKDELKIGKDQDKLKLEEENITEIHIISAYRDGLECGKPQFLFYAATDLDAKEIAKHFFAKTDADIKKKLEGKRKRRDIKKLKDERKVIKDGSKLVWIRADLLSNLQFDIDGIKYTGEVVKDKKDFFEGFFEMKPSGERKPLKGQRLPMVPSASASLVMFRNHLMKKEVIKQASLSPDKTESKAT